MATLFFGGYDIPFVNEANYDQNLDGSIWCTGFNGKSGLFYILVYVGTMDNSKIQVRSVNEPGLEDIDSIGIIQYAGNRCFGFIKTK